MMETLAPRALYDNDELGMTARLPFVVGVMAGGLAGLVALAGAVADGEPAVFVILRTLAVGVGMGAVLGYVFSRSIRRVAGPALDRWYVGNPAVVPPPAEGYLYRLPCSILGPSARVVGGVLYLGPRGLRFDPLLRTPPGMRESLVIEPLRSVQLELVQTPVPPWLWVWGRRTLPRILVRWPGGEARFGIPSTAGVFATLQDRVHALKQDPASGG
jgi:hypothetical protein